MRRSWPWTVRLPLDREEWRRKRDARRVLLEKVRARRAAARHTPQGTGNRDRSGLGGDTARLLIVAVPTLAAALLLALSARLIGSGLAALRP